MLRKEVTTAAHKLTGYLRLLPVQIFCRTAIHKSSKLPDQTDYNRRK